MVYEHLKFLKPYNNAQKKRKDGFFLVVTSEDLDIYFLNPIAADFFDLCDGVRTIEDIINILQTEYDVEFVILMRDILFLIRDLQWKKIIRLKV